MSKSVQTSPFTPSKPLFKEYDSSNVARVMTLMTMVTDEDKEDLQRYCDDVVFKKPRSPKGMVFISSWRSQRHTSNAAFICLVASILVWETRGTTLSSVSSSWTTSLDIWRMEVTVLWWVLVRIHLRDHAMQPRHVLQDPRFVIGWPSPDLVLIPTS